VCFLLVPLQRRREWSSPGVILRNRIAAQALRDLLGDLDGKQILDVGGGAGPLRYELERPSTHLVILGLDFSRLQGVGQTKDSRVCADGTRLPFRNGAFDAIVIVHSLEHIPQSNRAQLAEELKRVASVGVVIHGPAGQHAEALSHQLIEALTQRGMDVARYAREHLETDGLLFVYKFGISWHLPQDMVRQGGCCTPYVGSFALQRKLVDEYCTDCLEMGLPQPVWLDKAFPGCVLVPRRNLSVELRTILLEFTPILRYFSGFYYNRFLASQDDRPPYVEWTMIWRRDNNT